MKPPIQVMLAGKIKDLDALRYPVLASPKLDGIRAVVLEGVVYSRRMLPIPNRSIQERFGRPEFNGLDGELIAGAWTGEGVYNRTQSVVMSGDHKDDVTVGFWVFDDVFLHSLSFEARYDALWRRVAKLRAYHLGEGIEIVAHSWVRSEAQALTFESVALGLGYEGAMFRSPEGKYKFGRSTTKQGDLLKLKRFLDSEAIVLGFEEREHNANEAGTNALGKTKRSSAKAGKVATGMLGALLVRDLKTKVEFSVGTGFSDAQRSSLWESRQELIGATITYKYLPVGVKEKPRHPVFKGFRDFRDF